MPTREPRLQESQVASHLVPIVIGGDVLAYSFVREFHRAYGVERSIVIMTDDIKMLSSSKFTDCRIVANSGDPDILVPTLISINDEITSSDPEAVTIAVGTE